jgi:hypothetical protein
MSAQKIHITQFQGTGRVFTRDPNGLAAMLRGLAIDNARPKVMVAAVGKLTDDSTGTAGALATVAIPSVYDTTQSGAEGAQEAALSASFGKVENAFAVLAQQFNLARVRLGLPGLSLGNGTVATPGTIPAMDLAATAATGTAAADWATTYAACTAIKNSMRCLAYGLNEVLVAIGDEEMSVPIDLGVDGLASEYTLSTVPAIVAAASPGSSSVAQAAMTTFLATVADNVATMALEWNDSMTQGTGPSPLTDHSGGTAASPVVASLGTIVPFTTAGGTTADLAPKAGFDAAMATTASNMASLLAEINTLNSIQGLALIADASGGTVSATLAAQPKTLTAVVGSATTGLDCVTALTTWQAAANNVSTLIKAVNELAVIFDQQQLTDESGGVAGTELVALPATAAAVAGGANSGVAEAALAPNLLALANAITTLATWVNGMASLDSFDQPLHVVAG